MKEDWIRAVAVDMLTDVDVEYLSINEFLANHPDTSNLDEFEFDFVVGQVDEAIQSAVITISWED